MFPLSASILAYLLWNMPFVPDLMKLLYVYCLIFIPFLFRFGIQERIRLLDDQVFVSRSLGASHFRTWRYVVYPQLKHEIYVLASIGAFWCLLDFAIIKLFISEANYSLALTAQNWLASYRYYEAQGLIVMLTIWGIFMILGVHRALDRDI
jgi:ABC-type Fe3+ transport system permease subunit